MGSTEASHMVRADFFTPADFKWKYTQALNMAEYWDALTAVHAVFWAWSRIDRHKDLVIVVLKPYHRNAHPVMLPPFDEVRIFGKGPDVRVSG